MVQCVKSNTTDISCPPTADNSDASDHGNDELGEESSRFSSESRMVSKTQAISSLAKDQSSLPSFRNTATPINASENDNHSAQSNNTNDNNVTVAISPRTGVPLHLTVSAMLNQDEDGEDPNGAFRARQKAMRFVRKVLALLVLQYLSILIIVAPFCLLDDIQEVLLQHPIFSVFIGLGSFLGLVFAIYLVAYKGHIRRYAKIALCLGTSSFALALGSKLALVHWSNYALIAIAQATVNFSVLHALVQLDDHFPRVQHLQKGGAVWLGLVMAFLWIMVMREAGARWLVAATVPIGGWLYFCSVIRSVGRTMCHREPWDYLRAVIFILGPNVPDRWLFSLRRTTAKGRWTAIQSGVHLQGNISNKKRPNGMKEQKQKQKLSQQQEDSPLVATAGSYGGMENGTIIRV